MGRKKNSESAFRIEPKVPIPPRRRPGGSTRSKYPLDQMRIGDSFLVPKNEYKKSNYVANVVHIRARKLGIKIATRTTDDGVRVWRVE